MKKLILFIILILSANLLMAQKKCNDAVHPTNYKASILNCCIKEIKDGNIVVYSKDGIDYEIEAIAINLDRRYFELKEPNDSIRNIVLLNKDPEGLYQGHPYGYYQELYKTAKSHHTLGIILSIAGGGMFIGGCIIVTRKFIDTTEGQNESTINGSGIGLILIGAAGLGVGIPVFATNKNKMKKSKNAMEEIKRQNNLSLRITNNGLGLVLKF